MHDLKTSAASSLRLLALAGAATLGLGFPAASAWAQTMYSMGATGPTGPTGPTGSTPTTIGASGGSGGRVSPPSTSPGTT